MQVKEYKIGLETNLKVFLLFLFTFFYWSDKIITYYYLVYRGVGYNYEGNPFIKALLRNGLYNQTIAFFIGIYLFCVLLLYWVVNMKLTRDDWRVVIVTIFGLCLLHFLTIFSWFVAFEL